MWFPRCDHALHALRRPLRSPDSFQAIAYYTAQGFGWNWSKNQPPVAEARFSVFYSATLVVAALLTLTGIDPLTITIFSMALTAATLPVSIVPFLFLMNDYSYVRGYRNSWFSNLVVILIIGLAFVLAVVAWTCRIRSFHGCCATLMTCCR